MIRCPLGLRLDGKPGSGFRALLRSAVSAGVRGVVLEAVGDLSPDRLGETGRRELRHLLRSIELGLIALALPTRRSFEDPTDLDDRLGRIDRAMRLAYELGTTLVLIRPGPIPGSEREASLEVYSHALRSLAQRADHRGVRIGLELEDPSPAVVTELLQALDQPVLGVSLDAEAVLGQSLDLADVVRALGGHVIHTYAPGAGTRGPDTIARFRWPSGRGIDWAAFLAAFEEVGYRGYLTVWPEPGQDALSVFRQTASQIGDI